MGKPAIDNASIFAPQRMTGNVPFRGAVSLAPCEPASRAMLAVTLLHVAALFLLLYSPLSAPQQPVLSFTVTLMDLSSSPNSLSSAASSMSMPSQKSAPEKNMTPITDARATQIKKIAKPVTAPAKANARLSHDAKAQTAVLAPLTPAQFDAAYLNNPTPEYPPLSRRLGEQGRVLLSVFVGENGRAESVTLKSSSGFERLDNAAREAVSRWRFIAARQGEKLVASWVNVPVKFVLE